MGEFCEDRNSAAADCIALIGIGANLPGLNGCSPLETCRQAVALVGDLPGVRLQRVSRWFETAPVPPSGQPSYVNGVAALLVDERMVADPALLLDRLMEIEAMCGRARTSPNAARTLDLDIIGIGALVRDRPDPILPHPRAHLRAFVLAPLADVAPDWVHPVLGRAAGALLAALPEQDVRPL